MTRSAFLFVLLFCCARLHSFQGFYVGGGLGGHLSDVRQQGETVYERLLIPELRSPLKHQKNMFSTGGSALLYAGYGFLHKCGGCINGEVFAQFGSAHMSELSRLVENSASETVLRVKNRQQATVDGYQLGFDLQPGVCLDEMIRFYGRLGVSFAKSSLKNAAQSLDPILGTDLLVSDQKDRRLGLRAGAGIEHKICSNLSLRADYIFTSFGKFCGDSRANDGIMAQLTNQSSARLYDHSILFGLAYHFRELQPICFFPGWSSFEFEGGYFGASLGVGILRSKQQGFTRFTLNPESGNFVLAAPNEICNNQFLENMFVGYQKVWCRFCLGGEINVSGSSHVKLKSRLNRIRHPSGQLANENFFSKHYVATSAWQWALDAKPGMLLSPRTLLQGRIGVGYGKIKSHSEGYFAGLDNMGKLYPLKFIDADKRPPIFRLGLGLEYALNCDFHLRVDYIYNNFGTLCFNKTVAGVKRDKVKADKEKSDKDKDVKPDALDLLAQHVRWQYKLDAHLYNHAILFGFSCYF